MAIMTPRDGYRITDPIKLPGGEQNLPGPAPVVDYYERPRLLIDDPVQQQPLPPVVVVPQAQPVSTGWPFGLTGTQVLIGATILYLLLKGK